MVRKPSTRPAKGQSGGCSQLAVLCGAILAGAAIAVATTSGSVHIPPSPGWLTLAGAVVAGGLLAPAPARPVWSIVAAVVAGLGAGHVLLGPGVPRVHDLHHFMGIWAYGRAVHEGHCYPLWIPWLGFGMPLLQFYGPLNFLAALPAILAGATPIAAWKFEVLSAHVLAALSMLAAARLLGIGWRGGLLAATAFAFAPWRLCVADYRGAVAEANAFALVPLVAAATLRQLSRPSRAAGAVLTAAFALLVLTHAMSAFMLAIVVVPAAALALSSSEGAASVDRWRRVVAAAVPWALATAITAGWWIPAVAEAKHTALGERTTGSSYFKYEEHGLGLGAPFTRTLWDRQRFALTETQRSQGGEGQQMPFYAGAVLMASGLAAAAWGRGRLTAGLAAACLFSLLLVSAPAGKLLAGVPGFAALQFPWRFLSPASVFAALAIGAAWERRSGDRGGARAALPALAVVALLLWDAAPYTGAADRIPPYTGIVHAWIPGGKWTHWDRSVRLVPIEPAAGGDVVRVIDLMLPPTDYAAKVDSVFPHYPEWLTPVLYRTYFGVDDIPTVARGGIRWALDEQLRDPVPIPGAPYAALYPRSGGKAAPARFTREPGRVAIEVDAPPGGGRLRVLEQAFPGWMVRIDSGPSRVADAVDGFLSGDVPEGRHRATFSYGLATPWRRAGLGISVAGLLAACFVLFRARQR